MHGKMIEKIGAGETRKFAGANELASQIWTRPADRHTGQRLLTTPHIKGLTEVRTRSRTRQELPLHSGRQPQKNFARGDLLPSGNGAYEQDLAYPIAPRTVSSFPSARSMRRISAPGRHHGTGRCSWLRASLSVPDRLRRLPGLPTRDQASLLPEPGPDAAPLPCSRGRARIPCHARHDDAALAPSVAQRPGGAHDFGIGHARGGIVHQQQLGLLRQRPSGRLRPRIRVTSPAASSAEEARSAARRNLRPSAARPRP